MLQKGGKLISKFQQVKGKASKFWDGICKKTKVAGILLGATFGTSVDVGTDLIAGREIDLLQTFQQNLNQRGMGQLFGEPIDAASDAFLITATDFMLMYIYGAVKVQRKYNSPACRQASWGRAGSSPMKGASTKTGTDTTLHCAAAIDISDQEGGLAYFGRIKEEGIERYNETNV